MSAITTGFSSVYGAFNDQDFSYATTLPKKICQRRLLNTQLENVTRYPYRQRLNRAKTTTLNDSRQRWLKLILINHTDTLIKWFLRDDRTLMQRKKNIHLDDKSVERWYCMVWKSSSGCCFGQIWIELWEQINYNRKSIKGNYLKFITKNLPDFHGRLSIYGKKCWFTQNFIINKTTGVFHDKIDSLFIRKVF